MFPSATSVAIKIKKQRSPCGMVCLVKRVQFQRGTTVRQFLTGMFKLTQSYATPAECKRVLGTSKRHTYGCLLGRHVYFEGMSKDAKGRYTVQFGS